MKKETGELLKILQNSASIEDYLDHAADSLVETDLAAELSALLSRSDEKPADLFRKAGLERSYGYEILSGKKHPSRDKILAIFFVLGTNVEDAQRILKAAGYPPLYAKIERDSVILFALQRNVTLVDTNELLYEMGLPEIH